MGKCKNQIVNGIKGIILICMFLESGIILSFLPFESIIFKIILSESICFNFKFITSDTLNPKPRPNPIIHLCFKLEIELYTDKDFCFSITDIDEWNSTIVLVYDANGS